MKYYHDSILSKGKKLANRALSLWGVSPAHGEFQSLAMEFAERLLDKQIARQARQAARYRCSVN